MKAKLRDKVRDMYVRGDRLTDIKAATGVSLRSIARWAKDGNWVKFASASQRKLEPGAPTMGKTHDVATVVRAVTKLGNSSPPPPRDPPAGGDRWTDRNNGRRSGSSRGPQELRESELIDNAIDQVSACIALGDARSTGSLAAALIKLLIYRRTLEPQTIDEWIQLTYEFVDRQRLDVGDLYQALADYAPMQRRA